MTSGILPFHCNSIPASRRRLAWVLPLCLSLAFSGLVPGSLPQVRAQTGQRIPAPELDGATGYLGSDRPIRLADLRGKIVLLEFWTLC
jgi:hypothetical protein